MEKLKVTTIQADLFWEDKKKNLEAFAKKIDKIKDTDLIILPEMFTTGFSMNPQAFAEKTESTTLNWMREQAKNKNAVITGSFIAEENGNFYNRLIWMQPDGTFSSYDKRHLFTLAGEDKFYSPGDKKLIVTLKGWKILPLICYDLRFPVWSRNNKNYDLLIFIANFPKIRSHAWNSLLIARAIENQAFTIGVNRVGTDGNGIYYSGDTSVIDYQGNIIYKVSDKEETETITLSKTDLMKFRKSFDFLGDRDEFFMI